MDRPRFSCCPLKWRRPLPGCWSAACGPQDQRVPRWYLGARVTRPPDSGSATSQGYYFGSHLGVSLERIMRAN
jgi:hypothetical protein